MNTQCLFALLSAGLIAAQSVLGAVDAELTQDKVVITNDDHTADISRSGGVIELDTPYGRYRIVPCLAHEAGRGYREAHREQSLPRLNVKPDSARVEMRLHADLGTALKLVIEAREGLPGIVVASENDPPAYYFWGLANAVDSYYIPGSSGPAKVEFKDSPRTRLGYHPWVFHPAKKGGLAIVTGGTVGDQGTPYLHALPRWSGKVTFALAGVESPEAAAGFRAQLEKRGVNGLEPWKGGVKAPKTDYGQRAPSWLVEAEHYNGFYYSKEYYVNQSRIRE